METRKPRLARYSPGPPLILETSLQKKRILITGATGFIGAELVRQSLAYGANVYALCRNETDPIRLVPYLSHKNFTKVFISDLREKKQIQTVINTCQPEIILAAAGLVDWRQDANLLSSMIDTHFLATSYLLDAAKEAKIFRVVLLGSCGEYGAAKNPCEESKRALPVDPYSLSKLTATELALFYTRAFELPCTVVRPFQVYGPGEAQERLFSSLFLRLRETGEALECTKGEQLRDFVFVEEVAEGVLRAAIAPGAIGEIINLGTGVSTSVKDAILLAVKISQKPLEIRFGARPYRKGEPMVLFANMEKTLHTLGWKPSLSLEEGLRRLWYIMSEKKPTRSPQ